MRRAFSLLNFDTVLPKEQENQVGFHQDYQLFSLKFKSLLALRDIKEF
jgi:hypothetical protein